MFSNTLSRQESFENGDSLYSCGRAKTEVFKYDDVVPRFRTYDSKTLRVDADFFKYGEKKSPFSKIPGYVRMFKYYPETLRVDADFFV